MMKVRSGEAGQSLALESSVARSSPSPDPLICSSPRVPPFKKNPCSRTPRQMEDVVHRTATNSVGEACSCQLIRADSITNLPSTFS